MSLIAGRGCRWPPRRDSVSPVRTVVGGGVTRMMAPEDTEACVRAVERDAFDQTGQGFAIRGGDVDGHVIRDAFTP